MNKDEALLKVLALRKLAASTHFDGERENAEAQAQRLEEQFSFSQKELERSISKAEFKAANPAWYERVFFYEDTVEPHLKTIEAEINAVYDKMGRFDLGEQARLACKFYLDLKAKVETSTAWMRTAAVAQERRNQMVRAYYEEQLQQWAHGGEITYHTHQMARDMTASHCDIRSDVVETITGIRTDDLFWQQHYQDQPPTADKVQIVRSNKRKRCPTPPGYQWVRQEEVPDPQSFRKAKVQDVFVKKATAT